jgi:hypothetical protein
MLADPRDRCCIRAVVLGEGTVRASRPPGRPGGEDLGPGAGVLRDGGGERRQGRYSVNRGPYRGPPPAAAVNKRAQLAHAQVLRCSNDRRLARAPPMQAAATRTPHRTPHHTHRHTLMHTHAHSCTLMYTHAHSCTFMHTHAHSTFTLNTLHTPHSALHAHHITHMHRTHLEAGAGRGHASPKSGTGESPRPSNSGSSRSQPSARVCPAAAACCMAMPRHMAMARDALPRIRASKDRQWASN